VGGRGATQHQRASETQDQRSLRLPKLYSEIGLRLYCAIELCGGFKLSDPSSAGRSKKRRRGAAHQPQPLGAEGLPTVPRIKRFQQSGRRGMARGKQGLERERAPRQLRRETAISRGSTLIYARGI
jgi:hypothetical protein